VFAGANAGAFAGAKGGADRPGWGCFWGVFFQQTKALMKSVLCSPDFCDERLRPVREYPAWSKHWLFWAPRTLAETSAKT